MNTLTPTYRPAEAPAFSLGRVQLGHRLQQAALLCSVVGSMDDVRITHVAHDNRKVVPGGLFVAVRGAKHDGHDFIDQAIKLGARTIVCEDLPDATTCRTASIIQVSDTRLALAEIAAAGFGDPATDLHMTGVTGTNGKTTTAWLVAQAMRRLGSTAAYLGTLGASTDARWTGSDLTTPDALVIQQHLARFRDAGCTTCAMEVSSHALDQHRVHGVAFDVAVFTNLTRDHLDYHRTEKAYAEAKARLFRDLSPTATAVLNIDDPAAPLMSASTEALVYTYGQSAEADYRFEVVEARADGQRLCLDGVTRTFSLAGLFNAYNLAAAYGVIRAQNFSAETTMDALQQVEPAPGRYETFTTGDGVVVIIDFAHTPDALENVLRTASHARPAGSMLWCVFGCGGNRDAGKRPQMAQIVERFADRVVVTSDNPRTENPETIIDDVMAGFVDSTAVMREVDRRAAFAIVAREARTGDVVVIAGKGHETVQVIGSDRLPFDERAEVRRAFAGGA